MVGSINKDRHVFDELAGAAVNLVTKKAVENFFSKPEEMKRIISKTLAAAFAAGIVGSVLIPFGSIVFIAAPFLAFGHFTRPVDLADQAVKEVRKDRGLFNTLAKTTTKIVSGKVFKQFSKLSEEDQLKTGAKIIAVAVAVGLTGAVIGLAGTSLFIVSLPFAAVHMTPKAPQIK